VTEVKLLKSFTHAIFQSSYPFSEANFQDSDISRTLKFTEFLKFPELSRTSVFSQDFSVLENATTKFQDPYEP